MTTRHNRSKKKPAPVNKNENGPETIVVSKNMNTEFKLKKKNDDVANDTNRCKKTNKIREKNI